MKNFNKYSHLSCGYILAYVILSYRNNLDGRQFTTVRMVNKIFGDIVKFGISEKVMEELCAIADACGILRIMLFGSRARGDYHSTSDIDLAVWGGNVSLFALEIDEKTTTLLKYDVVDMNGYVQEELRNSIHAEGELIYEKI